MISQLPKWVEIGAFILALVAGYVNAIGLLGYEHQAVSHLSGTATILGTEVLHASLKKLMNLLGILLSFLAGASLAGYLLHGSTLKLGRNYHTALVIESILLFSAAFLTNASLFYGHFFASAACGLQNALATTYSGAIIRSTHVTGIFTDLGIMIGSFLRGEALDKRKAQLFLLIVLGFVSGGMFGSIFYVKYQFMALLIPAFTCLFISGLYWFIQKKG